jgi:hypothetical protein
MSHTYIAYKREDEVRVSRLVHALQKVGLDVWFDRELPGGEAWRAHLDAKLESAGCVVVVWSYASADPESHWVITEASSGLARKVLVPVRIDRVRPPPPFGEIQSIDLWHWKGDVRDPVFKDLVATIEAKLEGRPVPKPAGKIARMRKQAAYWSLSSAGLIALSSLAFNTFGAATRVCTVPGLQPGLSDTCGSIGLGNRPTRMERLAWAARPRGSCEALAAHVRTFPHGAYAQEAANLLTAKQVRTVVSWERTERKLPLFEGTDGAAATSETTARTQALSRALPQAERLCQGFGSGTLYRYVGARPEAQSWTCEPRGNGVVCGFDGQATCTLDLRQDREEATCGG